MTGKKYGLGLTDRLIEITGLFRKVRGCVCQIFVINLTLENFLWKSRKLSVAFKDLERAYDRVDRRTLKDVIIIYNSFCGNMLEGNEAFYY